MIEDRLQTLGLTLPEAATPSFNYVPVTLHRGVAYVAGQLPKVGGDIRVRGKAGRDVDLETAHGARRESAFCRDSRVSTPRSAPSIVSSRC